ncbi:MAG: hypothetical protein ISR98_00925 [Parcubacteria group bacterium]|nr:hypothetical protein [Parcubacteria group bacterium]
MKKNISTEGNFETKLWNQAINHIPLNSFLAGMITILIIAKVLFDELSTLSWLAIIFATMLDLFVIRNLIISVFNLIKNKD